MLYLYNVKYKFIFILEYIVVILFKHKNAYYKYTQCIHHLYSINAWNKLGFIDSINIIY